MPVDVVRIKIQTARRQRARVERPAGLRNVAAIEVFAVEIIAEIEALIAYRGTEFQIRGQPVVYGKLRRHVELILERISLRVLREAVRIFIDVVQVLEEAFIDELQAIVEI